jgi:3-isopropylmalate dehydrogenase
MTSATTPGNAAPSLTPAEGSVALAVVPGDGIGPEVTAEALKVLEVAAPAGVKFEPTRYDLGAERYLATHEVLPDSVLTEIREHDAILLGAVGGRPNDPDLPPGILERGLLLRLRFELDHYVNLRPSRIYPGVADTASPLSTAILSKGEVDFVVVREGTEGPYTGNGGALRVGTPAEIATEVSVNTAYGVERVIRDAFSRAQRRPRKKLTLVHKTNVLVNAGSLWWRLFEEVAAEHPDVTTDYCHIDAVMIYLATDPQRFDVIVTDNLFGDIVTDLAAAITGGIGLAASGNINPDRTAPSMFEPVHGSAPDIAGQLIADPTAAILSGALLLDHLGHPDAAVRIETAVIADLGARAGRKRSTPEVGDAIAARVAG